MRLFPVLTVRRVGDVWKQNNPLNFSLLFSTPARLAFPRKTTALNNSFCYLYSEDEVNNIWHIKLAAS